VQRARLLDAVFAVVYEQGYRGMAVRVVAERAGVSSKTFYDFFSDREDCFLAAFDYGVEQLAARARPAFEGERDWLSGIRAGLAGLLGFLDREPALRGLVFVEALGAGPRVLARRTEVLQGLTGVIDEGRLGVRAAQGLPSVIAEGVLGATFGVLHSRLSERSPRPLLELLSELTAMIVLPYRGRAASARELARPVPQPVEVSGDARGELCVPRVGSSSPLDFRLTVRSQMVLTVVGECPGLSNRRVSELAGISDQGQISRLMIRLAEQGLLKDTGGHAQGNSKAWRLTREGQDIVQANPPLLSYPVSPPARPSGASSRTARDPRRGRGERPESRAARLAARTQLALTAVSELGTRDLAPSNRQISNAIGIADQGQISKLLHRLETQGLLQNTGAATAGIPNAWRLTPKGHELIANTHPNTTSQTPQASSSVTTRKAHT
jgi:AcrR family transcriptional regulator/DNA-binding MarR family transcriptional regulator